MDQKRSELFDLGAWLGRGQAFGMLANQCSAAQAQCLRTIHDSGAYESLSLTWADFCELHVGLSRQRVDTLMQNLEEFGATYFRLSEIVRISPDSYRQIAPKIDGDSIEIGDEKVAIIPENAARIRNAVHRMRAELQKAKEEVQVLSTPRISNLQSRLDACFNEMSRMTGRPLPSLESTALRGLVGYSLEHLTRISKSLGD
jgi:hypothetical protein